MAITVKNMTLWMDGNVVEDKRACCNYTFKLGGLVKVLARLGFSRYNSVYRESLTSLKFGEFSIPTF